MVCARVALAQFLALDLAAPCQGEQRNMKLGLKGGLFLACTLACVGCGEDGSEMPSDGGSGLTCAETEEYVAGIEKVTSGGLSISIEDASPAPPTMGDNTWVVEIEDAAGALLDGATLLGKTWMPKHQHGTPAPAVTPLGNGRYELSPIIFSMDGAWEITVEVTPSGSTTESVVFKFCIEG